MYYDDVDNNNNNKTTWFSVYKCICVSIVAKVLVVVIIPEWISDGIRQQHQNIKTSRERWRLELFH